MHHVGMGDFHTVTLSVDMVNRTAALYTTTRDDMDPTEELKPCKVWNNLPDEVWVAVAMKRNSEREAVLLPRIKTA
jgi:hypothetical protein